MLEPPLEQSEEARHPVVNEGHVIDTRVALPDLTPRERARYQNMLQAEKRRLKPDADVVREHAPSDVEEFVRFLMPGAQVNLPHVCASR